MKSEILGLLQQPQANYGEAKLHAGKLDRLFGFECASIENNLVQQKYLLQPTQEKQFWIGLELQSLQTPYSEIVSMIEVLNPQAGQTWLDLGAGYGRMGLVLGFLRPDVRFQGYEVIPQRVDEGNRILKKWNLQNSLLRLADLAEPSLDFSSADVFFIYDFGSQRDVYFILERLRQIAVQKTIQVIARGRGMKNWIMMDFPWLSQVNPPKHFENWSLFYS